MNDKELEEPPSDGIAGLAFSPHQHSQLLAASWDKVLFTHHPHTHTHTHTSPLSLSLSLPPSLSSFRLFHEHTHAYAYPLIPIVL